ncbi:MAG: hypothetical protein LUG19_09675 [Desulfovibrio sp.]|uniref:hypothetical protein n=1 Tax=Desulfovibrio sp. TaxID=885 RepID=UPI0025826B64|nr:hypothetical protein [Desulfovibrio sp.]MCD7984501.1 hypothetical protein [Desulfovibrio sp.]
MPTVQTFCFRSLSVGLGRGNNENTVEEAVNGPNGTTRVWAQPGRAASGMTLQLLKPPVTWENGSEAAGNAAASLSNNP